MIAGVLVAGVRALGPVRAKIVAACFGVNPIVRFVPKREHNSSKYQLNK